MLMQGSPISINFSQGSGDAERFWYWRGSSGKRYIHTIYKSGNCPPLPGAIYVAVKRTGSLRMVIAIDRFSPFWDGTFSAHENADADEIHVHLLASDNRIADAILRDLKNAFEFSGPGAGFSETTDAEGLIPHQSPQGFHP